jgi:hypothetical protein
MSMNDGGFIVEIAGLLVLIMIVVGIAGVTYGIFRVSTWLYRKTRKVQEIKNGNET